MKFKKLIFIIFFLDEVLTRLPDYEANFCTFEPHDEVEYGGAKEQNSKDRLRRANEFISSLRNSMSPSKTNTVVDNDKLSQLDNSPLLDKTHSGID